MKGGTQGFPRHEVSDKQEVLFEILVCRSLRVWETLVSRPS